jgi:hypothetical protein
MAVRMLQFSPRGRWHPSGENGTKKCYDPDRGQTAQWQFQRDLWGGVLACPRVSTNPDA